MIPKSTPSTSIADGTRVSDKIMRKKKSHDHTCC
jgi:hypothetical protein